ncbi:MATE family Na+-driven efflux transporter [Iodobacter ciconiae]|uniref:Multidrug transporter n=1 Tax=Iodobacter ciconiae TaxID=2496266 RepID=A0A3S8ZQH1_9NEIS|nr:MATE family Na+-driven efflux transporter [Iodobacter ciconiae]AZN35726.1 multidrug transporter [Iodobacter ciconiae]
MKYKLSRSLLNIDYKFFSTLLIIGVMPTIYTAVRIFFLGDMPSDSGLTIASQLIFVNLIYEILQEAIFLPIFYLIGKSLIDQKEFVNKINTGLVLVALLYGCISLLLIVFVEPALLFMSQKNNLISATVEYIRIEAVAAVFSMLVQFMVSILIIKKNNKHLYIVSLIQMMLIVFFDTCLVSKLPFSMDIGVNGIAVGNLVVNLLLIAILLYILKKEDINIGRVNNLSFAWLKEWVKVGGYSGLESLLRNIVFILMVVRMINMVGEQGTFWLANQFIWGWLLLPVIQLGQLIKRDCGERSEQAIKENVVGYFIMTAIIISLWLATIPLWGMFIKNVMNVSDYRPVYDLVIVLLLWYILFAFNNVIDSIFYGIGKTNYMFFQSVAVNVLLYGGFFILFNFGVYKPNLISISLMFASGVALDSIITILTFLWFIKNRKIKILI